MDGSAINWRSAPLTPPYVRVSYTAVHNPSFQSLFTPIETIPYFMNRLQIFLGIGHPINENQCSHSNFWKDYVQSFLTCETYAVYATRFQWVLRLRLTSLIDQLVVIETSPEPAPIFLGVRTSSLPAGRQVSLDSCQIYCFGIHFKSVLDFTMMCLLIQPHSLLSGSCSSVPRFVVLLPSVLSSRIATLQLTNGSRRYPCPQGTCTL